MLQVVEEYSGVLPFETVFVLQDLEIEGTQKEQKEVWVMEHVEASPPYFSTRQQITDEEKQAVEDYSKLKIRCL